MFADAICVLLPANELVTCFLHAQCLVSDFLCAFAESMAHGIVLQAPDILPDPLSTPQPAAADPAAGFSERVSVQWLPTEESLWSLAGVHSADACGPCI